MVPWRHDVEGQLSPREGYLRVAAPAEVPALMCGLAGVVEQGGASASEALLRVMAGDLRHRGPDGFGLLLDGGVGIASTRLAIVDLEGGDQPISTEDRRFWALQNGEIYNHVELREELERRGHVFATRSDTEVVAHGYEEWGPGVLGRLNGDFALAVWDARSRELFLARDRFGVRPMFIGQTSRALSFASEVRALLRRPDISRQLDPRGLVDALVLWGISPTRSAFLGIRELPPGHYLTVREDGASELTCWWELDFGRLDVHGRWDVDDAEDELFDLLDDAVRLRLRADVPVGAYLSGGLDSSVLVALAARQLPGHLEAFGLTFPNTRFDESLGQKAVSGALGVRLRQLEFDGADVAAWFRRAVEAAEQPLLRSAPGPMLALSGLVNSSGLKVVLTGEGADELFAGYDIFKEARVRRFWARDPESAFRPALLARVHPFLDRDLGATGALGQRFFARGLASTDDPLHSHLPRFSNGERLCRLLDPAALDGWTPADSQRELVDRLPRSFAEISPLSQAQVIEQITFLQGMLLHAQGDRMLSGHSIEGRYPYLDHRVASFAARLPDLARLNGLKDKVMLRRVARRVLPVDVSARAKRPYRAPIASAFAGDRAPAWVTDLMQPQRVAATGVLDPDVVGRLAARAGSVGDRGLGEVDGMALAGALSIMVLHERLVVDPVAPLSLEPTRAVRLDASRAAA